MNNTYLKIQELWRYLRIQVDETMIVQVYNHDKNVDEYIIAEIHGGSLVIRHQDKLPEDLFRKPFRLIRHRDSEGHFTIPSASKIEKDKLADY